MRLGSSPLLSVKRFILVISRINYWKIGGIPRIVFAIFGICFYGNTDNNLCCANKKIIDIETSQIENSGYANNNKRDM